MWNTCMTSLLSWKDQHGRVDTMSMFSVANESINGQYTTDFIWSVLRRRSVRYLNRYIRSNTGCSKYSSGISNRSPVLMRTVNLLVKLLCTALKTMSYIKLHRSTWLHTGAVVGLTLPTSRSFVSMTTMLQLFSHNIRQKSSDVSASGPCVAMYARRKR